MNRLFTPSCIGTRCIVDCLLYVCGVHAIRFSLSLSLHLLSLPRHIHAYAHTYIILHINVHSLKVPVGGTQIILHLSQHQPTPIPKVHTPNLCTPVCTFVVCTCMWAYACMHMRILLRLVATWHPVHMHVHVGSLEVVCQCVVMCPCFDMQLRSPAPECRIIYHLLELIDFRTSLAG